MEVDAVSPDVVRQRVRRAIESHIDMRSWKRLQKVEAKEKRLWKAAQLGLAERWSAVSKR
jgi:hypothetical protein